MAAPSTAAIRVTSRPPPFELVGNQSVAKFANTTAAAPPGSLDSAPLPERANYYDVGVEQKFTPELTVGIDTYYKQSTDLIDEGQFGAPIILTPFNYRYGKQYGAEFTVNYVAGPLSVYFNAATQRRVARTSSPRSSTSTPTTSSTLPTTTSPLDHEQQYTSSAGASYLWNDTRFSVDALLGSGLREDLA